MMTKFTIAKQTKSFDRYKIKTSTDISISIIWSVNLNILLLI